MRPTSGQVYAFATARFQTVVSPQQSKELTASRRTGDRDLIERHGHRRPRAAPPGGCAAGPANTVLFVGYQADGHARAAARRRCAGSEDPRTQRRRERAVSRRSIRCRRMPIGSEILRWLGTLPASPASRVPRARRAGTDGCAEGVDTGAPGVDIRTRPRTERRSEL